MLHEITMAGFGGQGIMLMGQLLAYAGMLEGKQVSWMPSYGPEMRGGTANCTVIVSTEKVGSPILSEFTAVIAMNKPSLDKFEAKLKPGGLLIYNSTLIDKKPGRTDVEIIPVAANEIAAQVGLAKMANIVVLGALVGRTGLVEMDSIMKSLRKVLEGKSEDVFKLNEEALNRGKAVAASSMAYAEAASAQAD